MWERNDSNYPSFEGILQILTVSKDRILSKKLIGCSVVSLCSGTEILHFIKHLLVHADTSSVLHSSNASEFF